MNLLQKGAIRVNSWADLPNPIALMHYRVTNGPGETFDIVVGKKERSMLEGLRNNRIYAASAARLSHHVHLLRSKGVIIDTERYYGEDQSTKFGIYKLVSEVIAHSELEVSA